MAGTVRWNQHSITWLLLGGSFVSLALRIAGVCFSYLAQVLLSRLLGLHDYGIYVIALGWALVLVLPARIGFDNSSLRYITVYFENGQAALLRGFIRTAVASVIAASLLVGGLMLAVGSILNSVERPVITWAATLILPVAMLGVLSPMMRAIRKIFASQFYDQVLRPFLIIVGLLIAVVAGFRPNAAGAMMLTALAAFGALLGLLWHFRLAFAPATEARADVAAARQWFALSLPLFVIGGMQELMNQMEIILLGSLANARQAGLFAAAWRLASLVPFALVALAAVSGPMIASAYHREARDELHHISKLIARLGFLFALIASLVLAAAGKPLLGLFGFEFPAAYPALLVLLLGGIVNAFTGAVAYLLTLTGRERPALIIFGGGLLTSFGLNLALIPVWGAFGAAISSASALSAWNIAMIFYVRRTMGIDASAIAKSPLKLVGSGLD
jgi:O-antigen/teichoic acid export membrane protein